MENVQLLLIEGPIGAGKSTLAGRLAERLAGDVDQLHGFDPEHPIRTHCERYARELMRGERPTLPRHDPEDELLYCAPQWGRLAESLVETGRVFVCEGKLFQQCLEIPYLMGATRAAILAEHARSTEQMRQVGSLLVYLSLGDRRSRLEAVARERPEGWLDWLGVLFSLHPWAQSRGLAGKECVLAFYEEWEPIERELFDAHQGPKLMLPDAFHDWDEALRRVALVAGGGLA